MGLVDIGVTLARIIVSFTASMLAGTGIGLAMGLNRVFERAMMAAIR
jgi:ABC-type nitrate/sulfonate/bicarbonate transport system permease component